MKINFKDLFKIISSFSLLYLLVSLVLLLDGYLLIVFNVGFLNIDLNQLYDINIVKDIIIFITIFGVFYNGVTALIYSISKKYLSRFLRKPSGENYINYIKVKNKAIEQNSNFLMEYVNNELITIKKIKQNYCTAYLIIISIIVNSLINDSIIRKMVKIIFCFDDMLISIILALLVIVVLLVIFICIHNSLAYDEDDIYYK